MQLGNQRPSSNVEDRRGMGGAVGGGLGVGGIVIALIAYFFGVDPGVVNDVAEQASRGSSSSQSEVAKGAPGDEIGQFVAKVLGSTEEVWGQVFQQSNSQYRPPTLVLYDGQVRSACGMGQARFKAPGDDRLQKQTQGRVIPESFTHGTPEQRVRWFKRGMESGRARDCDTFSAASL